MEKTMKLSEAQLSFDQWNKVRSERTAGCKELKVLAVEKMAETATTFENWHSTHVFADELDMIEQKQKAFAMMQKTASCFNDWYEVASHCESDVMAIVKNNPNHDVSQELAEYQQVFETAKSGMLKAHTGYYDWDKVLSESYHLIELCDFALKMAIETAKSPMDYVGLYCYDPDNKELLELVLTRVSSVDGSYTEWLEAYEEYSPLKGFDNEIKSIIQQKMAESYTTIGELEKV